MLLIRKVERCATQIQFSKLITCFYVDLCYWAADQLILSV